MALEDLYREIILDHAKNPRNLAVLDHIPDSLAHENPSCGDTLKLEVVVEPSGGESPGIEAGEKIARIKIQVRGCAISTASASIMSELAMGKTVQEARELADAFILAMREGGGDDTADAGTGSSPLDAFDELAAFKGVMRFPVRVKCATLAWHALLAVLPSR
jgi:nitrogen fixation NifU-like protein